jgi:hypothetical protein
VVAQSPIHQGYAPSSSMTAPHISQTVQQYPQATIPGQMPNLGDNKVPIVQSAEQIHGPNGTYAQASQMEYAAAIQEEEKRQRRQEQKDMFTYHGKKFCTDLISGIACVIGCVCGMVRASAR